MSSESSKGDWVWALNLNCLPFDVCHSIEKNDELLQALLRLNQSKLDGLELLSDEDGDEDESLPCQPELQALLPES